MMGDSHIRIGASMARPPWTVMIPIALGFLLPLVQLWPDVRFGFAPRSGRLPDQYPLLGMLLFSLSHFLTAALLGRGLWRGSRFVHVVAILWWLFVEAGVGAYNLLINDYDWSLIKNLTQIGFFHGALPIAVGLLCTVLLLLPASWRWTHHRGLARP